MHVIYYNQSNNKLFFNNSKEEIDYVTVTVVYYQGEKAVGIDDGIESDVKARRLVNFTLDYLYDKKHDDISFDSYKVYINEAYSYN